MAVGTRLRVLSGPDQGREFLLEPGSVVQIGRSQTTLTHLTDTRVSRFHCEIDLTSVRPILSNRSSSGTRVNGNFVRTHAILQEGDRIEIGKTLLCFGEIDPADFVATHFPPPTGTIRDSAGSSTIVTVPWLALAVGPPSEPMPGSQLGHYWLCDILGEGGMGRIFHARDTRTNSPVALKVMKRTAAADAGGGDRFRREGQAVASLRSDHIVTIHEVGEVDGAPFIAMELLDGVSLANRLEAGPPLALVEVLRIGHETALGLAVAHEAGIIHRDIKPENIWLWSRGQEPGKRCREERSGELNSEEGTSAGVPPSLIPFAIPVSNPLSPIPYCVKLLDFGLARDDAADRLTRSSVMVGTVGWMSPEQVDRQPVDHRSDLFSLGCLLYRLCTGQDAFPGDGLLSVLSALATREPEPVRWLNPGVPDDLAGLVHHLLAKKRDDRPRSTRAVADELAMFAARMSAG